MKNKNQHVQKVLIRAVNECLRAGVITLDPQQKLPASRHEFEMEGIPTIVAVHDAGHGELSVKVTLWPTEQGRKLADVLLCGPQKLRNRGGFLAHTWLDRMGHPKLAVHGDNLIVYCEKPKEAEIEAISREDPQGFEVRGQVPA